MELSSIEKTLFKEVVDGTLFKDITFYSSPDKVNHITEHFSTESTKIGKMINLWAAMCEYVSTQTCELHQQLYDRWYPIGHGKLFFVKNIFPLIYRMQYYGAENSAWL